MLTQAYSRDEHTRDYREDELFITIECLRCELLEVAEKRSLSDHTVVEMSERLDRYILQAQKTMMESLRNRKAGNNPPDQEGCPR